MRSSNRTFVILAAILILMFILGLITVIILASR